MASTHQAHWFTATLPVPPFKAVIQCIATVLIIDAVSVEPGLQRRSLLVQPTGPVVRFPSATIPLASTVSCLAAGAVQMARPHAPRSRPRAVRAQGPETWRPAPLGSRGCEFKRPLHNSSPSLPGPGRLQVCAALSQGPGPLPHLPGVRPVSRPPRRSLVGPGPGGAAAAAQGDRSNRCAAVTAPGGRGSAGRPGTGTALVLPSGPCTLRQSRSFRGPAGGPGTAARHGGDSSESLAAVSESRWPLHCVTRTLPGRQSRSALGPTRIQVDEALIRL